MQRKWIYPLVGALMVPAAVGFQAQAADVAVMGNLQVTGSAQVRAEADSAPVRLSNDNYTYTSGETVRTQEGAAVLDLDGRDRLAFGRETEAQATRAADGYNVALNDGSVAYAMAPDSNVTVVPGNTGSELAVEPAGSSDSGRHVGRVAAADDGALEVSARNGDMRVSNGETSRTVEAGEAARVESEGGELRLAQAEGAGGGAAAAGGAGAAAGGISTTALVVGGLGAVAVAGGVAAASGGGGGDDDDELASP
jgi:hypothetical protein